MAISLHILDFLIRFFTLLEPLLALFVEELLVHVKIAILDAIVLFGIQLPHQRLHRRVSKLTHLDVLRVVAFVLIEGLGQSFLNEGDIATFFI